MDILNMRYRDNAWRPVPGKKVLKNLDTTFISSWKKIWLHVQDDINNYIGLNTSNELRLMNMGLGTSTLIQSYSGDVDVVFLKRFMIVISGSAMDKFLYKDDEYKQIEISIKPEFSLSIKEEKLHESLGATTAEAFLGRIKESLDELSQDGFFAGGMMIRAAYKLFDGSYVMHTTPQFLGVSNFLHKMLMSTFTGGYNIHFYAAKGQITFSAEDFSETSHLEDIIQSIVIFASKPEMLLDFSENTVTDDDLETWFEETQLIAANNVLDVSSDFKKLPESQGWYKIGEFSFSEILDGNITTEELDLEDFWMDWGTRETLPVDQFSHHSLYSEISNIYNGRLILADVSQVLTDYSVKEETSRDQMTYNIEGVEISFTKDVYKHDIAVVFAIDTNEGEKKVMETLSVWNWTDDNSTYSPLPDWDKFIMLEGVIGYPDARAKSCTVYLKETDGALVSYKKITSLKLTANESMNYAFYHRDIFTSGEYEMINIDIETVITSPDEYSNFSNILIGFTTTGENSVSDNEAISIFTNPAVVKDTNRVQLSEVNNPLFFPTKNSYQVGTGAIRDVGTNTEPLSTGQFGEYPLQVFTSKGIWALLQGQGDVVFSNVVPSSSHVIKEGSRVLAIGDTVIFQNEKNWIFALSGRDVRPLSKPLDNPQDVDFKTNVNFLYFVSHANVIQNDTEIDEVSFSTYLVQDSGAKFGFDKENNELVITNDYFTYSYVFSFDSGFWSRVSGSYSVLINNYPFLEGLNTSGLIRLSTEDGVTNVPVLFVTREQSLDYNEIYKKLDRSLIRLFGSTNSNKHVGYYIFGSDDLYNWQLTSGNDRKYGNIKDIRSSRSHKKWKYYIFVLAAELSTNSILTFVDTQFTLKANRKLR